MSQAGYLAWYTNADLSKSDAVRLLRALPKLVGIERANSVYRSDLEEHLANEYLGTELFRLYEEGTMLWVEADFAELGNRIEAVLNSIPEDVKGDFVPNRPFMKVGKRDRFVDSADESETPVPFTAMVGCWGYSTPTDGERMQSLLFAHPAVHAEKVRLEHAMGSLKQALYYEF